MKKLANKLADTRRKYFRRKNRTNVKSKTMTDLPRLIVNRSNKFIYAQVVDASGKVLAFANDQKVTEGTKIERAKQVGLDIAAKLKKGKVEEVCFDRNGFLFHGRVKSLADGAREGGLKI